MYALRLNCLFKFWHVYETNSPTSSGGRVAPPNCGSLININHSQDFLLTFNCLIKVQQVSYNMLQNGLVRCDYKYALFVFELLMRLWWLK